MKYYSTAEIQRKYNISYRRIQQLCKNGDIKGAIFTGSRWRIPESELEIFNNKIKNKNDANKLGLGISTYSEIKESYYFSDKSLIIKDILDDMNKVSMFLSPHGTGKTTLLDMVKTYFEIGKDNSIYFNDTDIFSVSCSYKYYLNSYPVIFISFKNNSYRYYNNMFKDIANSIILEYSKHTEIENNDVLSIYEKSFINKLFDERYDEVDIEKSIKILSDVLYKIYNKKCIVLIDNYDLVCINALKYEYCDEAYEFLKNLINNTFKDNSSLLFGIISGNMYDKYILQDINISNVQMNKYEKYFYFNNRDIKLLLQNTYKNEKANEVKSWAYVKKNNETELYNPISIIDYQTKDNSFLYINTYIENKLNKDVREKLTKILDNNIIKLKLKKNISYKELFELDNIFIYLLSVGMLKVTDVKSENEYNSVSITYYNGEAKKALEVLLEYNKVTIDKALDIIEEKMKPRVQNKVKVKKETEEKKEEIVHRNNDIQDYLL